VQLFGEARKTFDIRRRSVWSLLTAVLWIAFAATVIWIFYRPIIDQLLPRLSGVKAFGFEFSFAREELNRAIAAQERRMEPPREGDRVSREITSEARDQVLRRARREADIVLGSRILWVDDHPVNNRDLVRLLMSLGAAVDVSRSSAEAEERLERYVYDVIISDMMRDGVRDEGKSFVEEVVRRTPAPHPWVIYFIGGPFQPSLGVPKGVLGGTHRPDELLHLVLDALARERI
jgi:CheY-like chemotaxis protein